MVAVRGGTPWDVGASSEGKSAESSCGRGMVASGGGGVGVLGLKPGGRSGPKRTGFGGTRGVPGGFRGGNSNLEGSCSVGRIGGGTPTLTGLKGVGGVRAFAGRR